ncbi:hypothetical protein CERSUDRAFT_125326 [Gelatoporia subvermispora B]|uniref:Uncharacterized protein n=1 Tax=Ceriporiopsis subvermispora (strain B) TaxID=914234 RepID=M2R8J8_CERS8|nr:hypothetical protein CERSUDRAFT_125326 [Gelatoporia subvermispora B]
MSVSNATEDAREWHSIRPWRPTLTLSVREITSVSVTFILSSLFGWDAAHTESSGTSLGLTSSEDDDQDLDSSGDSAQTQIVSDVLAKGLSVKVNGAPWQRVLMKVDDENDEAVIILFGLLPGRQYDVELGILPGERSIRSHVTTDAEVQPNSSAPDASVEENGRPSADSSNTHASQTTSPPPQTTGSLPHPGSSIQSSAPPALTLEDRRLQLTHTLNLLNAEHASLSGSLKTARREAQKADAALRSEIEALKRAADKHAAGEQRARQKVLALQEAAKQGAAAARDLEALVADIEAALPALEARRAEVEKEWVRVKGEAERAGAEREEVEKRERRRLEGLQAELAGAGNRLERLGARRDKLEGEGGIIAELEEKLRRLEEERERIENDPYGYEGELNETEPEPGVAPTQNGAEQDVRAHPHPAHQSHTQHPHLLHNQRKRHSHPVPHPHSQTHHHPSHHPVNAHVHAQATFVPPRHGRPDPIQRPPAARASLPGLLQSGPGIIHLNSHRDAAGPAPARRSTSVGRGTARAGTSSNSSGPSSGAGSSPILGGSPAHASTPGHAGTGDARSRGPSQSTGSGAGGKSELNPGSSPFAPRSTTAQLVATQGGSAASSGAH